MACRPTPTRGPKCPKIGGSTFQIELAAQPVSNCFDHVATIRVLLRPAPHDLDVPGVLMRHDRDGQLSRHLANVLHLQPDGRLHLLAGF
jgi:hypothetical protein